LEKYIIFDFDGTIADTFSFAEKIGKDIANRYSITISSEEAREVGFKTALLKSGFPLWHLSKTINEFKKRMSVNIVNDVEMINGIKPVLLSLYEKYRLGILSSNSKQNIEKFLRRHNTYNLFEFIYSDSSVFGKHVVLKRLCKKLNIDKNKLIYVGDEDRDIYAANRLGIKSIAFSGGYNNESVLKKANPSYLVSSPEQILEIL